MSESKEERLKAARAEFAEVVRAWKEADHAWNEAYRTWDDAFQAWKEADRVWNERDRAWDVALLKIRAIEGEP